MLQGVAAGGPPRLIPAWKRVAVARSNKHLHDDGFVDFQLLQHVGGKFAGRGNAELVTLYCNRHPQGLQEV